MEKGGLCCSVQDVIAPSKIRPTPSAKELEKLGKEDLKERCRAAGLEVSGTKSELVARLLGRVRETPHRFIPTSIPNDKVSKESVGSADCSYVSNPQHRSPLIEKVRRKASQNESRFVHTVLTSCHHPPKARDQCSWIRVWKTATGHRDAGNCSFAHCGKPATLGAHVSNFASTTACASWYIVPACKTCNGKHNQAGQLRKGTKLVKVVQGPRAAVTNSWTIGKRQVLIGTINHDEADQLLLRFSSAEGKDAAAIAALRGHRGWPKSKQTPARELQIKVWPQDF